MTKNEQAYSSYIVQCLLLTLALVHMVVSQSQSDHIVTCLVAVQQL